MQTNLTYEIATNETFYEIKHFLKKNQSYSANRGDKIYTVRNNQKLIGLARLLTIEGCSNTLWLRGLLIEEAWRNQGIASELLHYIELQEKQLANIKSIVAFAEPNLQKFYEQNNYPQISVTQIPNILQQRFESARTQGKNWLCLQTQL